MTIATSYDVTAEFGALYDEVPAYATRRDVAFYGAEAQRVRNGPTTVLELGCGTGRILLPLARDGHAVTGIDASEAMLNRCRSKLAAEAAPVRKRTVLQQADARDFSVAAPGADDGVGGFTLAIAPFRILQHLSTTDDQLQCLASVRRHLVAGGRFAFDVFNPLFTLMVRDRSAEAEDTPERPLGDGRFFRRTTRVTHVHWVAQLSEVELIYYLRRDTAVERIVQAFTMRWYGAAELEHLLARSGFRVESIAGDFDRNPLTDASPEIVVVAVRDDP